MDKKEIQQRHVLHHFGLHGAIQAGGFANNLIKTIILADTPNRNKLIKEFPEYVKMVIAIQTGSGIENYPILENAVMEDRDQ